MQEEENPTNSKAANEKSIEIGNEAGLDGLTTNDLKRYKGFEDLNEAELSENLKTVKTIARIIATIYHQQNK